MMDRTHAQPFELMNNTVVAMSETATAVTEHVVIASMAERIHQRGPQRFSRQTETLPQPHDIDQPSTRSNALIRIDFQTHESCDDDSRKRVGSLELPQIEISDSCG